MRRLIKQIFPVAVALCNLAFANTGRAQESKQSAPPKAENSLNFDGRKPETPSRPSSSKRSGSSSKSSRSEVRTSIAYADDAVRVNRPLIIKSGKVDAKVKEQITEDLLVMCRILEKTAQEHITDFRKAAGIELLALSGASRAVRTMYIEDYGVIFSLLVKLPLQDNSTPAEAEQKESTANEEWEETRNELFGQKMRIKRTLRAPGPVYDEGDVNELKNGLVEAIKNAGNIRHLKPNDWITIVLNGPTRYGADVLEVESEAVSGNHGRIVLPAHVPFAIDDTQGGGDSTMILRVKKGQLDEAIKKDGSAEEMMKALTKVVSVVVY